MSPREIVSVTNPSFVIFLTAPWRRAFYKRQFIKRLRINKGISKPMLFCMITTRKVVFQMSSTWLKKTSLFFSFFPCHYVRPQLGFGRKWVNFVRPMSDDRLLFTAVPLWIMHGRTYFIWWCLHIMENLEKSKWSYEAQKGTTLSRSKKMLTAEDFKADF